MEFRFASRLLSFFLLLTFAAGISYQPLCAASLIDCPPCHCGGEPCEEEDQGCGTCEKSAFLASTVQNSKVPSVSLELVLSPFIQPEPLLLEVPLQVVAVAAAAEYLPLAGALRDIRRSVPIRGPSFAA